MQRPVDRVLVHCWQCLSQLLSMPEDMQISLGIAFEKRQCILSAATKDAYVCILHTSSEHLH